MVQENEIRIGNWFHHNEEWSNESEHKGAHDFQFATCHWYWLGEGCFNLDYIDPIPLTEEWLLRMGGDKPNDGGLNWQEYSFGIVTVLPIGGNTGEFQIQLHNKCTTVLIKYVHQLQNLYYALTGEELEVK